MKFRRFNIARILGGQLGAVLRVQKVRATRDREVLRESVGYQARAWETFAIETARFLAPD